MLKTNLKLSKDIKTDDVKNRYVSIEKAKEDYKVSITSDLEIDQNATEKLRNN